jgi:hypothetical protein
MAAYIVGQAGGRAGGRAPAPTAEWDAKNVSLCFDYGFNHSIAPVSPCWPATFLFLS